MTELIVDERDAQHLAWIENIYWNEPDRPGGIPQGQFFPKELGLCVGGFPHRWFLEKNRCLACGRLFRRGIARFLFGP